MKLSGGNEITEEEDYTFTTLLVHCGKHIKRRKRGFYVTYM